MQLKKKIGSLKSTSNMVIVNKNILHQEYKSCRHSLSTLLYKAK